MSAIRFTAHADGVHASNGLRSDRFHIKGLSWFGAEGSGAAPDGLWQRRATDLLDVASMLHFNALRLPLAVDSVLSNPTPGRWMLTANPELQHLRYLSLLERIVRMAAARGLLVMLDMHRLRAAVWPTAHGLWHDEGMPAARLEEAWRTLARHFCGHWNVFAADLFNEPWGASFGDGDSKRDWARYSGHLGSLVLQECPRWLIFVEGIGTGSAGAAFCDLCFWGENFLPLLNHSVPRLAVSGRLVLSPHLCTRACSSPPQLRRGPMHPDVGRCSSARACHCLLLPCGPPAVLSVPSVLSLRLWASVTLLTAGFVTVIFIMGASGWFYKR